MIIANEQKETQNPEGVKYFAMHVNYATSSRLGYYYN